MTPIAVPAMARKLSSLTLCLLFAASAFAQKEIAVSVWNGIPDPGALFYGYVAIEGGWPLPMGVTRWISGEKGMTTWKFAAIDAADKTMALYADFDVDPNLFYDQQHDRNGLLFLHWKSSIHCEVTVANKQKDFGIMFIENPTGFPSKYSCIIKH